MHHVGAARLQLLLAIAGLAAGYPAGEGAQQVLSSPVDAETAPRRKLSGRFLHITGLFASRLRLLARE